MFRKSLITAVALGACGLLAGCAAVDAKRETVEKTQVVKKGPETPPHRAITSFSAGLRCMDDLMIFYGVKDLSMLVEDLVDNTKKVNAGSKDMLISAMSEMTKRSRAVRLVAFGNDSGNLVGFLTNAEQKNQYAAVPQYDVRGSISQLDESLVQKQAEGAINIGPIGGGVAKTATSAMLALDLSVLTTADFSIVPGVTARNAVIVFKEGRGADAEVEYKKFGISYGMTVTKAEGQSQALRTLIELATIELMGKLTRTPYWKCLGATVDNDEIRNEVSDWYYVLSDTKELTPYMQKQLRVRGYYAGAIDGQQNADYVQAVANARGELGLAPSGEVDLPFFTAFLNSYEKARTPVAAPAPAAAPISIQVSSANGATKFKRGEQISLTLKASRDAHVYCYLQDETRKIQRFYPNRFQKDSLVPAAKPVQIPGRMRFQLVANDKGLKETVACFATDRDVLAALPTTVSGTDFESLPVGSIEQIRAAFAGASNGNFAQGMFHVDVN